MKERCRAIYHGLSAASDFTLMYAFTYPGNSDTVTPSQLNLYCEVEFFTVLIKYTIPMNKAKKKKKYVFTYVCLFVM